MMVKTFFTLNRPLILFLYGQVFFVLGLAIFLQSRKHSRLKLARDLRWLALFGILHGLHEWGLVFIPIQRAYLVEFWINALLVVQVWLLAGSFICLLVFGARLLEVRFIWVRWLTGILIALWLIFFAMPNMGINDSTVREWGYLSSTMARYLLGFSGALLSAYGLYILAHSEMVLNSGRKFFQMLRLAGVSLFAYAILGGLLVYHKPFFPANLINQQLLEHWFHIPVEIWRSLTGLILTISVIRALEIFEVEIDRLIEQMEIEAIQAAERERIGQEIHDGAMQGVYSVSLILNSMNKQVEGISIAATRLTQAQEVLGQVILDLRRYMSSLRGSSPQKPVIDALQELIAQPRFSSLVDIQLDLADQSVLDRLDSRRLLLLVQEALSNVVRHAEATSVIIRLHSGANQSQLTIIDNGHGFDLDQVQLGYGLRSMKEQAQMMGANLNILSTPGKGTTYQIICPHKDAI